MEFEYASNNENLQILAIQISLGCSEEKQIDIERRSSKVLAIDKSWSRHPQTLSAAEGPSPNSNKSWESSGKNDEHIWLGSKNQLIKLLSTPPTPS